MTEFYWPQAIVQTDKGIARIGTYTYTTSLKEAKEQIEFWKKHNDLVVWWINCHHERDIRITPIYFGVKKLELIGSEWIGGNHV